MRVKARLPERRPGRDAELKAANGGRCLLYEFFYYDWAYFPYSFFNKPACRARATASIREEAPRRSMMCTTWLFTVARLTTS